MASKLALGMTNALGNAKPHFEYLKETSSFSNTIKKIVGESYFKHTISKQDRYCEVLLDKEDPKGFVIYMKKLQSLLDRTGVFQVKCFDVMKIQGREDYQTTLLGRVKELAKSMQARTIFISFSPAQDIDINYWKENGFKIVTSENEKKNGIEVCLDLEINKATSGVSKNIGEKESKVSSKKRKFDELEDKNGDSAFKKRKLEQESSVNSSEKNKNHSASVHYLPMKGEIFLNKIIEGTKKFEGRIYRATCRKMKVNDELKLFDNSAKWGIICKITSLDVYNSFEGMLKAKGILALLPQLEADSKKLAPEDLMQKAIKIYKGFPGSNGVHTDGVVAIGVEFLKKV